MITFNHERFIAQAVESVLSQETDFPVELVIGEDCSTDSTRAILVDLKKKFPDRIRLLLSATNLGALENARQTFAACHGEYIALLEGDDYWTSNQKLAAQIDALEQHPEYMMCVHGTRIVSRDETRTIASIEPAGGCYQLDSVLRQSIAHTSSVVIRNCLVADLPPWYYTLRIGDWPLQVLAAERGSIYAINCIMSNYRDHGAGAWSAQSSLGRLEMILEALTAFDRHFNYVHRKIIRISGVRHCLDYVHQFRSARDAVGARTAALKAFSWSARDVFNSAGCREAVASLWPELQLIKRFIFGTRT